MKKLSQKRKAQLWDILTILYPDVSEKLLVEVAMQAYIQEAGKREELKNEAS